MASRTKLPMMTMATAAATPAIESPVRSGRRSIVRTIMRRAGGMAWMPRRSSRVGPKRPGAGGRMASAGGRRTVATMAFSVPTIAVARLMPPLVTSNQGAMRWSKAGKRKNSAYSAVNIVPRRSPMRTPSAMPNATTRTTSLR